MYSVGMDDIDLSKLTTKEQMFVFHYLKTRNGTQSVYDAGFDVNGENSASSIAYRLLRNVKIRPIMVAANEERLRRVKIDADWVLEQLKTQYEFNIDDFVTISEAGKPYFDFSEATPEQMHCIEQMDISPTEWGTKIKIKTMGKKAILEMIGKHTNVEAFKENIEVTAAINVIFDENDRSA